MRRLLLSIIVLVCLVPVGAAEAEPAPGDQVRADAAACWDQIVQDNGPLCVVQYVHMFDLLNSAPMNLHRPPDDAEDLSAGFTGTPGIEPLWDLNQMRFLPSAGPVNYETGRVAAMSGLALDVVLDPDVPIFGYWSMSADLDEFSPSDIDRGPNGDDPRLGVLPCLTVRMTIETGRFPGDGRLLTSGQQTKTLVTGAPLGDQGHPDVSHACPSGEDAPVHMDDAVTFEIEIPPVDAPIPADEGFHVVVSWWNHAPGDPDDGNTVYASWWNVHTGPEYAPRLVLPVQQMTQAELVAVHDDGDRLFVEGHFNTPFGFYAVDPATIRLQVLDDGVAVDLAHVGEPVLRYENSHDGYFRPMTALIPWEHTREGLPAGDYTMRLSASDLQGNPAVSAEAPLALLDPDAAESPALPPSGLVLLLLAAGALGRRRVF